jgi:hypothetical protein
MPSPLADYTPYPPPLKTLKNRVYAAVLEFLHAMRTAPNHGAEEAIEWATLEKEFEIRLEDEKTV